MSRSEEFSSGQGRKDTPEYRNHYSRGYSAARGRSDTALDRADSRGEPSAWYDGYADRANGQSKWHRRDCTLTNHNDCR